MLSHAMLATLTQQVVFRVFSMLTVGGSFLTTVVLLNFVPLSPTFVLNEGGQSVYLLPYSPNEQFAIMVLEI